MDSNQSKNPEQVGAFKGAQGKGEEESQERMWTDWFENPFHAIKAAAEAAGVPEQFDRVLEVLRESATTWASFDCDQYLDDLLQEIGGDTNIVCEQDPATKLYRATYDGTTSVSVVRAGASEPHRSNVPPFRLTAVTGGWFADDQVIPAYTNGVRWNGWQQPLFPTSSVRLIAQLMPAEVAFDEAAGVVRVTDGDEEPAAVFESSVEQIEVDGKLIDVFCVGSGWCWETAAGEQGASDRDKARAVLSGYVYQRVADLYDENPEFANALRVLAGPEFEFPDYSYLLVRQAIAKADRQFASSTATAGKAAAASSAVAAVPESQDRALVDCLCDLVQAVEFLPLGVRGIKAVHAAKMSLGRVPGTGYSSNQPEESTALGRQVTDRQSSAMAAAEAVLEACQRQVEKGRSLSNLNLSVIVERAISEASPASKAGPGK